MNRITLFGVVPTLCLAAACTTMTPVPPSLAPGDGASLAQVVPAKGVQIYECRTKGTDGHEWAFVAPDAQLFDRHGDLIGHHGAGPYWQAADGSRVVGAVKARADAPAAGSIPWLLLSAKSTGPQGTFSRVTSIQRVNTEGGTAPAQPCNRESLGRQARIAYAADYVLFTSNER